MLLDSDSNATIFNNKRLVNDTQTSNQSVKAETNGNGLTESTLTCKVPKMKCKGWHNKNSMINTTSLADMADDYEVTMDTSKDKAMFVHLLDKIVCFGQMKNQLHGLSLKDPKRHVTQD